MQDARLVVFQLVGHTGLHAGPAGDSTCKSGHHHSKECFVLWLPFVALSSLHIISQFLIIIDCKEVDIVFSTSKQGGNELLKLFLMEDVK
ncbi:hypothetical protein D5086_032844 [Populus alba]|uniref:Uncharacterized protein n=1 Tax=Populus alba TaxID=43335 RepID=A0ACC4AG47_POPAL